MTTNSGHHSNSERSTVSTTSKASQDSSNKHETKSWTSRIPASLLRRDSITKKPKSSSHVENINDDPTSILSAYHQFS